ncbi:MAG: pyrroline-5-carboxylate reductase [Planctomycetes bacterium]|nr:pyrroline-5-carboxylate reductase [Planctomycetota bacterium]
MTDDKPMVWKKIGFIGAGQMATAMGRGFVEAGMIAAEDLSASDPSEDARAGFAEATGGRVTDDNREVAAAAELLILAVKPQYLPPVLAGLKGAIRPDALVVSIAAGVRLDALAQGLDRREKLVRVMPNTPCLVGEGALGYSLGEGVSAEEAEALGRLLGSLGQAFAVEEKLLDAVTGLSGSGPAFVFAVIEALSDGGVKMGLPRPIATTLAAQTVRGAAQMVLTTGEHTGTLKDRVTSPGGTTIAGIAALESGGLRAALIGAVEAACQRSIELGSSD